MSDNTDQQFSGLCSSGIWDFEIEFKVPYDLPDGSTLTPEEQGLGINVLSAVFTDEWFEWCLTAKACPSDISDEGTGCGYTSNEMLEVVENKIRGIGGWFEGAPNIPFIKLTSMF